MTQSLLESALAEHLGALKARDIERFAATIAPDVCVVDGAGAIVDGRDAVLASHAGWFASADRWQFEYAPRRVRAFGDSGYALIDVTYRQTPESAPARFLLSLIFARGDDGQWRFVYDQNTTLHGD